VLAVLRLPPFWADVLLPVRVVPLLGATVVLWVLAALAPAEPSPRPRALPWVRVAAAAAGALLLGMLLRGAGGLPARISDPRGPVAELPPAAIDLAGPDLREVPFVRKWSVAWDGELHVPRTGAYRLWADGRGGMRLVLDGHPLLEGQGDPLVAGSEVALEAGTHQLRVELERVGAGPRLRLGWTRPTLAGPREETIGPRHLGPRARSWAWWLVDLGAHALAVAVGLLAWTVQPAARRATPAPTVRARPAELAASAAGHLALVAVMSWPLVTDPVGLGFTNSPDGRLNTWILAWDAHALLTSPSRLFDAPVFHPLPDALAFSENLLLPALVALPANLAGRPVLGYNLALVVSLVVSALGTQLLARRAGATPLAAFAAGAFFAIGPHRWTRLAHLHAQVTLFLPFALLALDRFHEKRTFRRALLVGGLVALQGLSSVYLGAITALFVAAGALVGAAAWSRRETLLLLAGGAAGLLPLVPLVGPYLRMRSFQGMEWTLDDIATYATTLTSYAASGTRLWGGLTQRHLDPALIRDTLFPGLTLLGLGLAGLSLAPRRFRWVAVVASVLAVVFSLGPETAFYRFLHEHVVLVRGVRALSRFSLVPLLALCVLAGLALSRRPRLVPLALAAVALESANMPLGLATAPAASPAAVELSGGEGAVAVIPPGPGDTEAMLDQLAHWRPLVNGDSGFIPLPYARTLEALQPPLGEEAWRLLRALGATSVVEGGRVAAVPPGESARAPDVGTPVGTRFTVYGIVLALGDRRPVQSVVFPLGDGPWPRAPQAWISDDGHTWSRVDASASLADAAVSLYASPRGGHGEVRLAPVTTRFIRLDMTLPVRPGALEVR
jgi:hypothetical protein